MRRGIVTIFTLALGWALFAGASTASATTYVSLTFDDGNADQLPAVQMLADHGMDGTFYIITNRVGQTAKGYMTWDDVQSIYDHGNEIGGHTRDHVHLNDPMYTDAQVLDQICGGRQDLLDRGYPQVSFAYPFGDHDTRSEDDVQACGYLTGRRVSGLGGEGEPKADTIPPQDPMLVRTRGSVDVNDTLPEIKDWITDAEAVDAGNGNADAWFTLVFHHLCDPDVTNCSDPNGVDDQYITPADFDSLLDFLQVQGSTLVRPMAQVMDPVAPTSQISCNGAACQSSLYGDPVSVSLSANDTGGSGVSGVRGIRYTTDGSTPNGSSQLLANGGQITVGSPTTVKYRAEDNARNLEAVHSQTINVDDVGPTTSLQCDGAPCLPIYDHPVQATLSATDNGGAGVKDIRYTTDGSDPTATSPVYSDPITVGATTTIKFRAEDNFGNVEPVRSQTIVLGLLGAFSSFSALPNGTGKLVFHVALPGTLDAVDAGVAGKSASAARKKKKRAARIKPASKSAAQAGQVTLVIRASKAGKRILRRKHKLVVPVRLTFRPFSGSSVTQVVTVKLRLKHHHR